MISLSYHRALFEKLTKVPKPFMNFPGSTVELFKPREHRFEAIGLTNSKRSIDGNKHLVSDVFALFC